MNRPYLSEVAPYLFEDRRGDNHVPGIGLFKGLRLIAHLTPSEAIDLANHLVDLAESLEVDK